jgi:hypothetical protein
MVVNENEADVVIEGGNDQDHHEAEEDLVELSD